MDIRTGYHYTSIENWAQIKTQGLRPYRIQKAELMPILGTDTVKGVWIWPKRPRNLSHIGCVIYQIANRGTLAVVLLTVEYDYDSLLEPPGKPDQLVTLPHKGRIGKLEYHNGHDVGIVHISAIPPERLRLEKIYKLLDAWHEQETL